MCKVGLHTKLRRDKSYNNNNCRIVEIRNSRNQQMRLDMITIHVQWNKTCCGLYLVWSVVDGWGFWVLRGTRKFTISHRRPSLIPLMGLRWILIGSLTWSLYKCAGLFWSAVQSACAIDNPLGIYGNWRGFLPVLYFFIPLPTKRHKSYSSPPIPFAFFAGFEPKTLLSCELSVGGNESTADEAHRDYCASVLAVYGCIRNANSFKAVNGFYMYFARGIHTGQIELRPIWLQNYQIQLSNFIYRSPPAGLLEACCFTPMKDELY